MRAVSRAPGRDALCLGCVAAAEAAVGISGKMTRTDGDGEQSLAVRRKQSSLTVAERSRQKQSFAKLQFNLISIFSVKKYRAEESLSRHSNSVSVISHFTEK